MNKRWKGCRGSTGSALILTVVLTSLLAIVGVLFLMAARLDKMATSATADNRQLGFAVDSVVAQISDVLARDMPWASPMEEYYDYPDRRNAWLADLEPNAVKSRASTPTDPVFHYTWHQISDITGGLLGNTKDVNALTVGEREIIDLNRRGANADADGDGVGDARWFAVPGVVSGKGKPIYAAVRIVDNSAMLNLNTGFRFDPNAQNPSDIDGNSQLQVNAWVLSAPSGKTPLNLLRARATSPAAAADLETYEEEIIWRYDFEASDPVLREKYIPFDLSDELELRYRYLLDQYDTVTRAENWGWFKRPAKVIWTPVDSDGNDLDWWYVRATGIDPNMPIDPRDPNMFAFDSRYAYRHLATAYNLDRVIMPSNESTGTGLEAGKMVNVNAASEYALGQAVAAALAAFNPPAIADPAQIIANIKDYIDDDDEMTVLEGVSGTRTTSPFFGFEQPCIYLSELTYRFVRDTNTNTVYRSYAVELCKPYFEDPDPRRNEWQLVIHNPDGNDVTVGIQWSGTRQFHVLLKEDSRASLETGSVLFNDLETPADPTLVPGYDPTRYSRPAVQVLPRSASFSDGATIELQRNYGFNKWLTVDLKKVPPAFTTSPSAEDGAVHKLQRDISRERCILRFWGPGLSAGASLGNADDNYVSGDERKLQAHPANRPLTNIGELGKIFAESAYNISDPCGTTLSEDYFLINLAPPANSVAVSSPYENLFNYLTVIDPAERNPALSQSEMRVKGRININTAPIFVLAQLPWMTGYQEAVAYERARAIVDYRNKHGAFESIGALMRIPQMHRLGSDGINNLAAAGGPDLTPDNIADDLEERDLLFTRVSNLVTVRSDVFTAYILVRIGLDGPQKRVVAILDRSSAKSDRDPVRVLALEQVPDPR